MSSNEELPSQKSEGEEPPDSSLVTRAGAQKGHSLQRVESTGRPGSPAPAPGRDVPGNKPGAATDMIFSPVSQRVSSFNSCIMLRSCPRH